MPSPGRQCQNCAKLYDTRGGGTQTMARWGKTSTHLMTRSVRGEVFSVKIKAHREERHRREELVSPYKRKEKTEFLPLQKGMMKDMTD